MARGLDANAVVLVTGASTGLGLALSRRLLKTSHRLVLTARRESLSRFTEAGIREDERVAVLPLDVTRAAEREALVAQIAARWGGVQVLINNAGVAYRAVVEHITDGGSYDQMNINFRAPLELIRLVLPGMRARRAGRILTVSSVGGMMAMPTMALYSASKFAIEGACEALWYEVRPWGIHVSLIEPGFIRSESFNNTRYTPAARWAEEHTGEAYHSHYRHMARMIARMMGRTWATPERVAAVVVRTMERRRPPLRVPATPDAVVFDFLRRVLPRRLYHALLYASLPRVEEWGGPPDEDAPASESDRPPRP